MPSDGMTLGDHIDFLQEDDHLSQIWSSCVPTVDPSLLLSGPSTLPLVVLLSLLPLSPAFRDLILCLPYPKYEQLVIYA